MAVTSASACFGVTLGFNRPKTWSHITLSGGVSCSQSAPGNTLGCIRIGSQIHPLTARLADEAGRRNADDRERVRRTEAFPDDIGMAVEAPLPVIVADDGVAGRRLVLRCREQPADGGMHAKHVEKLPETRSARLLISLGVSLVLDLPGIETALRGHHARNGPGVIPERLDSS